MERYAGWENRSKDMTNITEVSMAKPWMGPIGVEKWSFNPDLTRLTDR